ncbi:hypothetical protein RFI_02195, partial [Reticulomyxa filosa]
EAHLQTHISKWLTKEEMEKTEPLDRKKNEANEENEGNEGNDKLDQMNTNSKVKIFYLLRYKILRNFKKKQQEKEKKEKWIQWMKNKNEKEQAEIIEKREELSEKDFLSWLSNESKCGYDIDLQDMIFKNILFFDLFMFFIEPDDIVKQQFQKARTTKEKNCIHSRLCKKFNLTLINTTFFCNLSKRFCVV